MIQVTNKTDNNIPLFLFNNKEPMYIKICVGLVFGPPTIPILLDVLLIIVIDSFISQLFRSWVHVILSILLL